MQRGKGNEQENTWHSFLYILRSWSVCNSKCNFTKKKSGSLSDCHSFTLITAVSVSGWQMLFGPACHADVFLCLFFLLVARWFLVSSGTFPELWQPNELGHSVGDFTSGSMQLEVMALILQNILVVGRHMCFLNTKSSESSDLSNVKLCTCNFCQLSKQER